MAVIQLVVNILPIGVFFSVAKLFLDQNTEIIFSALNMLVVMYIGYAIVFFVFYPIVVRLLLKMQYIAFLKHFLRPILISLVTCSSSAAFPITIERISQNVNASYKQVSGIALLLKHANCIQTPIYCMIAAHSLNQPISFELVIISVAFGLFSSIGTAGIANGGVVMVAVIYSFLGYPLEYVSIIAGIYFLIDIWGTCINVIDDCIGLSYVQRMS